MFCVPLAAAFVTFYICTTASGTTFYGYALNGAVAQKREQTPAAGVLSYSLILSMEVKSNCLGPPVNRTKSADSLS